MNYYLSFGHLNADDCGRRCYLLEQTVVAVAECVVVGSGWMIDVDVTYEMRP